MLRPSEIRPGDTYTYSVSNSDYPASAGWTLKVTINSATCRLQVSATTNSDGQSYDVTLSAAGTLGLTTAGAYALVEAVEKGTGAAIERHTIYQGTVSVLVSVTAGSTAIDARTHARIVLDAIEAAIEGRATRGQLESTVIGDRQVQYLAPTELIKWRAFYKVEVAREEAAGKIAQGLDGGNRIMIRMGTGSWR